MYLWESEMQLPRFSSLDGNMETEVLIIGGGISGILCAHMLRKQGIDYVLLEGSQIGSGTTKGTTAAITPQHGKIYTKLVKKFGKDKAKLYLEANLKAVRKYEEICSKIECDFEKKSSYIYSRSDKQSMKVEAAIVRELGFEAKFTEDAGLPFEIAGAVCFPDMAQFHPLKFLSQISKPLNIREDSFVENVKGGTAYTKHGKVTANKIIFASHYPFVNTRGLYPLKLYQKRSFVAAVEDAPRLKGTYAEDSHRGIYLRNYGDLLLIGGGDHRTGTKNDGFQIVRDFVSEHFPKAKEKYAWAAQDCVSLDGVPYIGKYSKSKAEWYVMTGFNEWGITSAMSGADIITDLIIGRENKFAELFAPDRLIFTEQLFCNIGHTLKSFCTPGEKRCSHLGCRLKENIIENTWDCPCHGSRFDEDGRLIDNPAMKNL